MEELKILNNAEFEQLGRKRDSGLGYVYCVEFGKRVKIGYSHDINKRIKQLEVIASYAECNIGNIAYIENVSNCTQIERKLHDFFAPFRIEGTELFKVNFNEVIEKMRTVECWSNVKKHSVEVEHLAHKIIEKSDKSRLEYIKHIMKKTIDKSISYFADVQDCFFVDYLNNTFNTEDLAKELGFFNNHALMEKLVEKGVYFTSDDTYVISGKYECYGYEIIKQEVLDNGKVIYHRRITQMGREFILSLLNLTK